MRRNSCPQSSCATETKLTHNSLNSHFWDHRSWWTRLVKNLHLLSLSLFDAVLRLLSVVETTYTESSLPSRSKYTFLKQWREEEENQVSWAFHDTKPAIGLVTFWIFHLILNLGYDHEAWGHWALKCGLTSAWPDRLKLHGYVGSNFTIRSRQCEIGKIKRGFSWFEGEYWSNARLQAGRKGM